MSERSVESSVYFPPFTLKDMDFHWSGTDLKIDLKKALEPDRTYIFTIGTAAIDLRNNYLARSYNLVFSTGPQIDTGTVRGMIYVSKKTPYTVAAYPVVQDMDTLHPYFDLAKYVTQSDDSGSYELQGLAPGKYRLICFNDEMNDFLYAPQLDHYASATHDIGISRFAQEVPDIDFMPSREDTSLPQLYSAGLARGGFIELKFSEEMDTATILPQNFTVMDSATQKPLPVVFAARQESDKFSVILRTATELSLAQKYFVTATENVKDDYGNPMSPDHKTVTMVPGSATTKVAQYYFSFTDSLQGVTSYDTLFCQVLPTWPASDSAGATVSLLDSLGRRLEGFAKRESQDVYLIKLSGLASMEWYRVKLSYPVGSGSGIKDSVVTRYFKTVDSTALGDIEGSVGPVKEGERVIVTALSAVGKTFTTFADTTGKFKLDGILEGNYSLRAYVQHGSSMKYFAGRSFPYQFAEPFGVYPEPIKVRARWTTEGVGIRLR